MYGAALAETWKWLNTQTDADGAVDMGIASLGERLPEGEALARLNAPSVSAPVMLPAHVDCWAQTAPEPMPTPDVSLFLHGPKRGVADVQVCWRADLDLSSDENETNSLDVLSLVPPASAECLPVPIAVFRRWLAGNDEVDDSADVGGSLDSDDIAETDTPRKIVRWRGREFSNDKSRVVSEPKDIRPGEIVVIPASVGGWESLGDLVHREGEVPVLDWGDRAYRQMRAKAVLRLHPAVIHQWPESPIRARMLTLVDGGKDRFEEAPDDFLGDIKEVLTALSSENDAPAWLKEISKSLCRDPKLKRGLKPHPLKGFILQGSRRLPARVSETDTFSDEDDAAASGTVYVPLTKHLKGVAEFAHRFASGCGLSTDLIDAIERAGLLHDLGKADPRFQALLRGGSPWVRGELLAKSGDLPQNRAAYERAREAACYPKGGRHELLSVRLVESAPELLTEDDALRDLVLHLVASHHGHCRPFAPVIWDDKPQTVSLEFEERTLTHSSDTGLERLDSGVAERFWRLVRRYGWWGLAWLEAVLRLADHRRSEWEEQAMVEESKDDLL